MKDRTGFIAFIVLFIVVLAGTRCFQSLPKRPQGVHLWAQADRASVALNYYQFHQNFLKPTVNYTKADNGVTGMEFPVMNYLASLLYRVFGFNELWYRFIMMLFVSAGVISAYFIANLLSGNRILSVFLTLMWFLSPVLDYYTPNFIPDAASLGLIIVSWLFYFRYSNSGRWINLIFLLVFGSLAALIKITSLISIVAMGATDFFMNLKKPNPEIKRRWLRSFYLWFICFIILIPVVFWYRYAEHLNDLSQHGIFTLEYHPVRGFTEFKDILNGIFQNWFIRYYNPLFYLMLIASWVYVILNFKKADKRLLIITILLYTGDIIFMLLMFKQFRDHDYYIITLLPAPLFQLILTAKMLSGKIKEKISVKIMASVLLISIIYTNVDTYLRYHKKENNKIWDFSNVYGMDHYLRTIGISKDDRVIVIYDGSFDISLYLMNVQGWTMWPGTDQLNYLKDAIEHKVKYIILRNPEFLKDAGEYQKYFNHQIGEYKGIEVFRVDY